MNQQKRLSGLGRYAIYFDYLAETIKRYRSSFFGRTEQLDLKEQPGLDSKTVSENKIEEKDKEEEQVEKLEEVVEKAHNILIQSKAVFPFDLFPDTITIDRQKLTVVHRTFFGVKQTVSVQHSDIKNIQADIMPLMGSITITSEHFVNNTWTISYLPKKDVLAIQQLVQGFITANNEDIDLADIEDEKLIKLLDELGRGEAGERPVVK